MWDQRYAEPGFAYGTEPNDYLRERAARLPAGGRVLCLAAGEGRNAVFLAEQGHRVHAVDASRVGLDKAEALAAERGVEISTEVADLARYAVEPASWDGVISIFAHLPPPVRARIHREVVAGLRPGGVLILEAYHPEQLAHGTGGPPTREMLYDLATLRDELDGLALEEAREVEREIVEGRFHTGRGAVVQIVGVKP
ncbi:MAG TPA: class I SAM-dependent methyltransferase [Sandaracinaceae bacterium LLY-WYZ-13_1]|nr:class I SAM-dependent methyltransferase [Sandaracinaceae bacterium LLY-WYZ-13_1]